MHATMVLQTEETRKKANSFEHNQSFYHITTIAFATRIYKYIYTYNTVINPLLRTQYHIANHFYKIQS
jgi:hypothetical protein